jgi:hypothetical protein
MLIITMNGGDTGLEILFTHSYDYG